jgi:hypothetical protein
MPASIVDWLPGLQEFNGAVDTLWHTVSFLCGAVIVLYQPVHMQTGAYIVLDMPDGHQGLVPVPMF